MVVLLDGKHSAQRAHCAMVVMIISDNYKDIKKTFFQPEVECFGETSVEKQQ